MALPQLDPLPDDVTLKADREKRRRARISASVAAKHAHNPLYRERVNAALSKHWDGNGKRLAGVWAMRDRVRELEDVIHDLLFLAATVTDPQLRRSLEVVGNRVFPPAQPASNASPGVAPVVKWLGD